jgi:chromosome segregation ATPase
MKTQDDNHAAEIRTLTDGFADSIAQIGKDNQVNIDALNASFANREQGLMDFIRDQNTNFDTRYGQLNDSFNLLNDAFSDLSGQYDELNRENQRIQAELVEQQRRANNAARASVPTPVASAELPVSGDSRDQQQRLGKNNNFSQLTVLSGLGDQGSPSSGLQLA